MFACLGIGGLTALAVAADSTDLIWNKVRNGIQANLADTRSIACMAAVERTRYVSRGTGSGTSCAGLIAATANTPRGPEQWRDRLRLDVSSGNGTETFALTGAGPFERGDVSGVLRAAAAGRGEFSAWLANLIGGEAESIQSRGLQQTPLGKLLAFGFTVPAAKSHFFYGATDAAHVAYRGSIYALADSSDLKRLTMEAEDVGDACRVQYTMDYTGVKIGDHEIVLPQSSTMEALYRDGKEFRTETYYSGCRRQATPVLTANTGANAAPKPLPAGIRFKIRFQAAIDGATAAAGDPIVGVIRTTLKDKQNGILVHAGDRLHGRITSVEEYLLPQHHWSLAIAFQTIERGVGDHGIDQGVEQPVTLMPLDESIRVPMDDAPGVQKPRPSGGAYFIVAGAGLLLEPKFETEWETR